MNLLQLKYSATALKNCSHSAKEKKIILHVTVPEGQPQHLLTGCRQHYCSLNAVRYRLRNFSADGSSYKELNFLCAPLKYPRKLQKED